MVFIRVLFPSAPGQTGAPVHPPQLPRWESGGGQYAEAHGAGTTRQRAASYEERPVSEWCSYVCSSHLLPGKLEHLYIHLNFLDGKVEGANTLRLTALAPLDSVP